MPFKEWGSLKLQKSISVVLNFYTHESDSVTLAINSFNKVALFISFWTNIVLLKLKCPVLCIGFARKLYSSFNSFCEKIFVAGFKSSPSWQGYRKEQNILFLIQFVICKHIWRKPIRHPIVMYLIKDAKVRPKTFQNNYCPSKSIVV